MVGRTLTLSGESFTVSNTRGGGRGLEDPADLIDLTILRDDMRPANEPVDALLCGFVRRRTGGA